MRWILFLFQIIAPATMVRLRCGNYSQTAFIEPASSAVNSGVLVTWDLVSSSPICTDPATKPLFTTLRVSDVSVIARCDECPRCTVRLPQRFEMPLGTIVNTIFIVTRKLPFHRMTTDMDVKYVIVDKMPKSLRNCEVIVREKEKYDKLVTAESILMFVGIFVSVVFCVCVVRCLCSRVS